MKKLIVPIAVIFLFLASCTGRTQESSCSDRGTHTHADGSVHHDHDHDVTPEGQETFVAEGTEVSEEVSSPAASSCCDKKHD